MFMASSCAADVCQVPVLEDERRHPPRHSNRHHVLRRRWQFPHEFAVDVAVSLLLQPSQRHVPPPHPPFNPPPPSTLHPSPFLRSAFCFYKQRHHSTLFYCTSTCASTNACPATRRTPSSCCERQVPPFRSRDHACSSDAARILQLFEAEFFIPHALLRASTTAHLPPCFFFAECYRLTLHRHRLRTSQPRGHQRTGFRRTSDEQRPRARSPHKMGTPAPRPPVAMYSSSPSAA